MVRQVRPYKRWPSGSSVPLAALRFSPEQLASRYELTFEELYDDLGGFKLAAIALRDGSQTWLERHRGDPVPSTLAHVDANANLKLAKEELKQVLELTEEDFVWISPLVDASELDNRD